MRSPSPDCSMAQPFHVEDDASSTRVDSKGPSRSRSTSPDAGSAASSRAGTRAPSALGLPTTAKWPLLPPLTARTSVTAVGEGPRPSGEQRSAFDACTLRTWFIEMDTDNSGVVTKDEFINFLRNRKVLQNILRQGMLEGSPLAHARSVTPRTAARMSEALGIKRILKIFRDIDSDQTGTLRWEHFLEFFRRTGLLLEYATPNNPRDRMADMLGKEHHKRQMQAKWHRAGADAGGLRPTEMADAEQPTCQFIVEQQKLEKQKQWLTEKSSNLMDLHQKGLDAWSISNDACSAFRSPDTNCLTAPRRAPVRARPMACLESLVPTPRAPAEAMACLESLVPTPRAPARLPPASPISDVAPRSETAMVTVAEIEMDQKAIPIAPPIAPRSTSPRKSARKSPRKSPRKARGA